MSPAETVETAQPSRVPADRRIVLVGANPGLRLFDGEGADAACVAFASCWRVDWCDQGPGTALIVWTPESVHLVGENEGLARWLEQSFTRHFPEAEGLAWPAATYVPDAVEVVVDLASGSRAVGGGFEVTMAGILDRRAYATDEFDLGGMAHSLSLVLAPCVVGGIVRDGAPLAGQVRQGGTPERPTSSAFTADAEVWRA